MTARPPRSTPFPYTTLFRSMVRLKTLAPRHDLGQRLELCRRDGSAKGLDHEGLNRRSIEMGPSCFGEGAVPIRAEGTRAGTIRSEEHTSELQSLRHLVCRLL